MLENKGDLSKLKVGLLHKEKREKENCLGANQLGFRMVLRLLHASA